MHVITELGTNHLESLSPSFTTQASNRSKDAITHDKQQIHNRILVHLFHQQQKLGNIPYSNTLK